LGSILEQILLACAAQGEGKNHRATNLMAAEYRFSDNEMHNVEI
jgi:hypothetical protein